MKKFLIGAAALSLLAGPAFAQHMDRHDNHRPAVQNHGPGGRFTYRGRSFNRVRGPAWAAPRGWSSRRYTVGAYLPRTFLSTSYVVNPFAFGLGVRAAPAGYQWVRVGDDLYLVSWTTGRVAEVVPDVFY